MPQFSCPGCSAILEPRQQGRTQCPRCNWRGEIFSFNPRALDVRNSELALPDEATCIHHPTKKATAVCAGTGDYICALCAVELDGEIFSAEFLNSAGRQKAGRAFQRMLPRPDSRIQLYLLLPFIPYVNVLAAPFAFLWLPHGFVLYSQCRRMRREDPLFARLVGPVRMTVLPILLTLWSIGWIAGVVALVVLILKRNL